MQNAELTQHLILIEERLTAIEAGQARLELALSLRVPAVEIRQAFEDVLETRNVVGQIREVRTNTRDSLVMLIGLAAQLLTEARNESRAISEKHDETNELLIQLRELGRKHVRGLADLERAQDWHAGEDARRGEG